MVWVTPPEVPVITSGTVPGGVPGIICLLASSHPPIHTAARDARAITRTTAGLGRPTATANFRSIRMEINARAKRSGNFKRAPQGQVLGGSVRCTIMEGAVVLTVTVNGEAEMPSGVTGGGAVQFAREGAPLQLSATVPLKPPAGVSIKL